MKFPLSILALLLATPLARAADCAAPEAVARQFQQASMEDLLETPATLLTPGLAHLFASERACQIREEGICNLDISPWLDGQDGDITGPMQFVPAVMDRAATTATVEVRYPIWDKPHATRVILQRATGGCWRVDDLRTDSGLSLRALLGEH